MVVLCLQSLHRIWLGSPVFGNWWPGLNYKEVYIIPAILGSLALVVFAVDLIKTCSTVFKEVKEPAPKKEG